LITCLLHGKPLSFRSRGFSPRFTLLHACILNSDDSTSSHDEASSSYRTLYYPQSKRLSDIFGGWLKFRVFSVRDLSSNVLLRVHSLMDASNPTTSTSLSSHLLFTQPSLGNLRSSSGLFPSRQRHLAAAVGLSRFGLRRSEFYANW